MFIKLVSLVKENIPAVHVRSTTFDIIHYGGKLNVSPFEYQVINSKPVWRLQYIRKMLLTSYRFIDANHTRFSHSLGFAYTVSRLYDNLMRKFPPHNMSKEEVDRNRLLLRLAAILHDVGHFISSHDSEPLFPEINGIKQTHEDYTRRIIVETEIADIFKDAPFEIKASEVAALLDDSAGKQTNKDQAFMEEILHGPFDADRMDNLKQDEYFIGRNLGNFDYEGLLDHLALFRNDSGELSLGIESKGYHALETLIMARLNMYQYIYLGKTTRILRMHFSEYLKHIFPLGVPHDLTQFLRYTDSNFSVHLMSNPLLKHADALDNRRNFWRCFCEFPPSPRKRDVKIAKKLHDALINSYGADEFYQDIAECTAISKNKLQNFSVILQDGSCKSLGNYGYARSLKALKDINQYRFYAPNERYAEFRAFTARTIPEYDEYDVPDIKNENAREFL